MSAIADLDVEPTPKRLGFCGNFIGAVEICGRIVMDDDVEMVELPMKNNRRQFICGKCCERLLSPKAVAEEPEKGRTREHVAKLRTGARLPMGKDLRKR